MREIKVRTSFSLPLVMVKKLKRLSEDISFSTNEIALLCLRKMLKSEKLEFSQRETVIYNKEWPCTSKIHPYLTQKEHLSLRVFRMNSSKSISYHLYLAILEYLEEIVEMLSSSYTKVIKELKLLRRNLEFIHRKITFSTDTIFSFGMLFIDSG